MTTTDSSRRPNRFRLPVALAATLAASGSLLTSSPAEAIDIRVHCGFATARNGWVANGSGWSATTTFSGQSLQTESWNGIRQWEDVVSHDGSDIYNLTNQGGTRPLPAFIGPLAAGTYAATSCVSDGEWSVTMNSLWIPESLTTPNFIKGVMAHEFGHALRISHSGKGHQIPANEAPVMSTCSGSAANRALASNLTKDDNASAMYRSGDFLYSGTHFGVTPNPGFEQGETYWGVENALTYINPSGGNVGPKYMSFWPGSVNTGRLWQTTTVKGDQTVTNTRGIGNFKKFSSTDQKGVEVSLWTQKLYFADGCGEYRDGKNWNSITSEGPLLQQTVANHTPSTSWTNKSTPDFSLFNSFQSERVRVEVRSGVLNSSGAVTPVAIDNVRVGIQDAP